MTDDEFNALFDTVEHSAFRYEGLPVYAVDEEDSDLAAWRAGAAMAERSVRTDPWLARIALQTVAHDIEWVRVRYAPSPLSWYVAWEVGGYVESQAAGERILLTSQRVWDGPDFWLLDAGTAQARGVIQTYKEDGSPISNDIVPAGSSAIEELEQAANALIRVSTELNPWIVAHRDELHRAEIQG